LIILIIALLATGCSTLFPAKTGDAVMDRVLSARKIIIGTSADYRPFEYYDNSFQITGFDPAIARELGARLGVQVEFRDIPFEGLFPSMQVGQIDAAIAAISVTPDRQAVVDFTDVYYTSQDSILARQGSGIGKILSPVQLAQYRVGVQTSSTYERWLQTTLIMPGLMRPQNLLQYQKPEHAVRDLRENRNDLIVMGSIPAQTYLQQGGLEEVGKGFNVQLYAIAVPKGANVLQARLNEKLAQMRNDGTLARLAFEHLQLDIAQSPDLPVNLPGVVPPAVVPTTGPKPCFDNLDFVRDITIPDGSRLRPGEDFDKIWRIRNSGSCTWDTSYRIDFVQGDMMGGAWQPVKNIVPPGATYDIVVDQRAPLYGGNFMGIWQMVNGQNVPFGRRLWVKITVPGSQPATAIPAPTPVQPILPVLPPGPQISYFRADSPLVRQGDLIIVRWSFSGAGLAKSRLSRTDPDGRVVALYGGADVPMQGAYEDLALKPGAVIYTLLVGSEMGGTSVSAITVNVTNR
jgi:polar amino acid transport system substrate-binding protein